MSQERALEKFKLIIPDLIESWFCRIYAILMAGVVVAAFSGLVVFSVDSSYNANRLDWNMFFTIQDEIKYPPFFFRTEWNGERDATFVPGKTRCMFDRVTTLQLQPCGGEFANWTNRCLFMPGTEDVVRASRHSGTGFIMCEISMTPADEDILLFGVEESPEFRSSRHVYLFPNNETAISLERIMIKPMLRSTEYNWVKTVNYLSSDSARGFYRVGIRIDSFRQIHYIQGNDDPGVMAVGDIGGFTYFLFILHVIIMFFVGFCFPNKSKFLGAHHEH